MNDTFDSAGPIEDEEQEDINSSAMALADLKNRATVLGINFHPSIGMDKLKAKLDAAALEDEKADQVKVAEQVAQAKAPKVIVDPRKVARNHALRLSRVRITCMDPSKKEYEGDIFQAGNSVIGTYKKFVKFNTEYHLPQILLNMIKEKKFQTFATVKMPNGVDKRVGKLVNTYAVEMLEPLTPQELKELEQRQAMAAGRAA